MPIPCYLALTAAEFAMTDQLPEKIAWMACHFSCYGTGLSNLPQQLPAGSMIILNDRTPADRHDPLRILEQLLELEEQLQPDSFLLDFQRCGMSQNQEIAQALVEGLHRPIAVTAEYAADLPCAVFVEVPPLHTSIANHIAPWMGREVWLELASETRQYTVTSVGCMITDQENHPLPDPVFTENDLFCRYHTELAEDAAIFTLQRTQEDLNALLKNASGITRAVGLYQQLGMKH